MLLTRLRECPNCGYSLRGLPARHACPECGFVYDENTRVWKPSRTWSLIVISFGLFPPLFLVLVLNTWLIGLTPLRAVEWLVCVGGLIGGWVSIRRFGNRRFAAISARGIRFRTSGADRDIAWSELGEVRLGDFAPFVGKKGEFLSSELVHIFDNRREMRQFIACAEAARAIHADAGTGDAAPANVQEPVAATSVPTPATVVPAAPNDGQPPDRGNPQSAATSPGKMVSGR